MGRSLSALAKGMKSLGVGSTFGRANSQLKHGRVFTITEAKPARGARNSPLIAPDFYGVLHQNGVPEPARAPKPLHSVLKRDWHCIINAEADPSRAALLRPSPQGAILAREGVEQLLKGSPPFAPDAIAAAAAEKQAELERQRALSAEKLAARDPATLKTTPKAAPAKKKKK